jgi:BolA protein
MSRQSRIEAALNVAFNPQNLQVVDESHQHAGHAGAHPNGETHYRVFITANSLADKSRVEAHRAINDVLKAEFDAGLHALAIKIEKPSLENHA